MRLTSPEGRDCLASVEVGPDGRVYVAVQVQAGQPPKGGWPTGPDGEADDADADGDTYRLACGNGWMLRSVRFANGSAALTAVATSVALAKSILAAASRDAVEEAPANTASFGFWYAPIGCS